jgi:hypothetical protein
MVCAAGLCAAAKRRPAPRSPVRTELKIAPSEAIEDRVRAEMRKAKTILVGNAGDQFLLHKHAVVAVEDGRHLVFHQKLVGLVFPGATDWRRYHRSRIVLQEDLDYAFGGMAVPELGDSRGGEGCGQGG